MKYKHASISFSEHTCRRKFIYFFFFNDTATTEIYTVYNTLSLHDALPIWAKAGRGLYRPRPAAGREELPVERLGPTPASREDHRLPITRRSARHARAAVVRNRGARRRLRHLHADGALRGAPEGGGRRRRGADSEAQVEGAERPPRRDHGARRARRQASALSLAREREARRRGTRRREGHRPSRSGEGAGARHASRRLGRRARGGARRDAQGAREDPVRQGRL